MIHVLYPLPSSFESNKDQAIYLCLRLRTSGVRHYKPNHELANGIPIHAYQQFKIMEILDEYSA